MPVMVLRTFGGLLIAFGTMWALQGLGILNWPPQSFMLARREWALYGGFAILIGLAIVWLARRGDSGSR